MRQIIQENLDDLLDVALEAGSIVMEYFKSGKAKISYKKDKTPVTDADLASDKLITERLAHITPGIKVISEEGYEADPDSFSDIPDLFWCVDPLDGTKNFIKGEEAFTVNIGLIEKGVPIFGMLYVPCKGSLYYCTAEGGFKLVNGVKTKLSPDEYTNKINIVVSRRAEDVKIKEILKTFSDHNMECKCDKAASSEKFCYVCEGKFSIFPSFAECSEWDTAAGHAIINSVGGKVFTSDGNELTYGKKGFKNPYFLVMNNSKILSRSLFSSLLQILD